MKAPQPATTQDTYASARMTSTASVPPIITGLHHVTAFAKDPATNVRFYTEVLGLRLVKRTVNFDDPLTYHLYYGDPLGSPGTLLTHFPHPAAARARHGGSEITDIMLAIPRGSLGAWRRRLDAAKALDERPADGLAGLRFVDPDGMRFGLVEVDASTDGTDGIRGIERPVITVPDAERTIAFLARGFGFTVAASEGNCHDLTVGAGGLGQRLRIVEEPALARQPMGAGTIHHVAWRVPDEAAQRTVREALRAAGAAPTAVIDRQYFRSIYVSVPGGILFEVATDGPGFDVDEPRELLGTSLMLPPQHEPRRAEIERTLPPLAGT